MKNLLIVLLCITLLCSCSSIIAFDNDGIKVVYDGQEIEFDVQPEIIENHVMVPMRKIFETFGAKVKWDDSAKTITAKKKSKTIQMTIGSSDIIKNDETFSFDAAPIIKDGKTLIPVRALGELLGLQVEWDEETKTVIITTPNDEDNSWKENTGEINLSAFTVTGEGNSAEGKVITVTKGGDYTVSGTCADGQILIDTEEKVKLRLSGMNLKNTSGAAIYVKNADKVYITLTEGTENYLEDGETYTSGDEKEKGCITARDNLEIKGKGALFINGNMSHGIFAADSLEIENGNLTINAKNDGIHVNDTFQMTGGSITINAEGDGIAADEIVDITDGVINIKTVGSDAQTEENADISSKGIKADWMLDISGGSINITSTDHAIHCASEININGGDIWISSDNKGISAHENLTINGGNFNIVKSTEGIESKKIMTINDGTFNIIASDDGLNAGGNGMGGFGRMMGANGGNNGVAGNEMPQMPENGSIENAQGGFGGRGNRQMPPDMNTENGGQMPQNGEFPQKQGGRGQRMTPPDMSGDGSMPAPDMGMRQRGMTPPDINSEATPFAEGNAENQNAQNMPMRGMGGGFGGNSTEISTEHHIQINGGTFNICAVNDGIDSNGSLVIEGGEIVIEGRALAGGGEMGLDTDMALIIRGGEVLAAGTTISESGAEQNTALIYLSESVAEGSKFEIKDKKGNIVSSIDNVQKTFAQILCSSPQLKEGAEYEVYVDGNLKETFTVSGKVTTVGTVQNSGFFGMGNRGGMMR